MPSFHTVTTTARRGASSAAASMSAISAAGEPS
jgi:hypothetical protein